MAVSDEITWTGGMWGGSKFPLPGDMVVDHAILNENIGTAYGKEIDGIGWNYIYKSSDLIMLDILWVPIKNYNYSTGQYTTIGYIPNNIFTGSNNSYAARIIGRTGQGASCLVEEKRISIGPDYYIGKGKDLIPIRLSWLKHIGG